MLKQNDNDLLCRVEGKAPMGTVLRQYWLPAILSEEVPKQGDGAKAFRLLGERLIAWRDAKGTVSVLPEACPHRGASLTLARDEGDGLRCIYHGWKIDPSGLVVDTPAEPPSTKICGKLSVKSYPTWEAGGMVWAYLGGAKAPKPPAFEWLNRPSSHYSVRKSIIACNFVQAMEGTINSSHSDYLHSSQTQVSSAHGKSTVDRTGAGTRTRPSADRAPRLEVHDTEFGFVYVALRQALDDPANLYYARATAYAVPVFTFVPPGNALAFVPIDDVTTGFYHVVFDLDGPLDAEVVRSQDIFNGFRGGIDLLPDYRRTGNASNHWLQDRAAMKGGLSFTGIEGTISQDVAVTESMGPIQDRTGEHLGQGDKAIMRMRRLLLARAKEVVEGKAPVAEDASVFGKVQAASAIIPQSHDWWSALFEASSAERPGTAAE